MRAISAFREGLRALIEELAEIPAVWEDQPRPPTPMTGDDAGALLLLSMTVPAGVGRDDVIITDVDGLAVVADDDDDTLGATAHGFVDADELHFQGDDLPEGVDARTLYFVRDATADTFRVSLTEGGAAVDLESVGSDVRVLVAGEDLEDEYRGQRTAVLTVKAECTEQGNGRTWHEYIERVRDRLAWRSTTEALSALDAALHDAAPAVQFKETRDGREISVGALDIHLGFSTSERDTAHRYPVIERLVATGEVNGETVIPSTTFEIGA